MKRALLALAVLGGARAAGRRRRPPARQLHHQPLQPRRRIRRPRLRAVRARPRRDPDLPGEADCGEASAEDRPRDLAPGRRACRALAPPPACPRLPAGRGRAAHARGSNRRTGSSAASGRARTGSSTATRPSPAGSAGRRSSSQHDSGARVPSASAPAQSVSDELRAYPKDQLSSPLDVRSARARARSRARAGSRAGPVTGQGARLARHRSPGRRRRVRGPHLPGEAERRLRRARAPARVLLGSGARAQSRARQVDRGRLPGRDARDAEARRAARPDRDDHAHHRRLRARARDARALRVHLPRAALPVAQPRLRAARRLRRLRCPARPTAAPAGHTRTGITTTTTATTTTTTTACQHARPARGRDLGRPHPVPDRARRAARGDLAPPRRLRARPDPRLQPRASPPP